MAENISSEIISQRLQANLTRNLTSPRVLADEQIRDQVYESAGPEVKLLEQASILNDELMFVTDLKDPVQLEIFTRVQ